jgi:hypothetical protein
VSSIVEQLSVAALGRSPRRGIGHVVLSQSGEVRNKSAGLIRVVTVASACKAMPLLALRGRAYQKARASSLVAPQYT